MYAGIMFNKSMEKMGKLASCAKKNIFRIKFPSIPYIFFGKHTHKVYCDMGMFEEKTRYINAYVSAFICKKTLILNRFFKLFCQSCK